MDTELVSWEDAYKIVRAELLDLLVGSENPFFELLKFVSAASTAAAATDLFDDAEERDQYIALVLDVAQTVQTSMLAGGNL